MSPQINPSIPVAGQPNATEETKIVTALTQLVGAVNAVDAAQIVDGTITSTEIADGTIQPADLQSALADVLGANVGATIRRGRNVPATTEITVTSLTPVTHANDADITVTQPTLGVTLIIASVDGHGSTSPTSTAVAYARIDGTTDVVLGNFVGATYSTQNVIVPKNLPGTHTYRFTYATQNAGGTAYFASRSLFVVTLGL